MLLFNYLYSSLTKKNWNKISEHFKFRRQFKYFVNANLTKHSMRDIPHGPLSISSSIRTMMESMHQMYTEVYFYIVSSFRSKPEDRG
jgi:hypothetical protein